MALYRNVTPLLMPTDTDRDEALADAEALLVERGVLQAGRHLRHHRAASRWATRAEPTC